MVSERGHCRRPGQYPAGDPRGRGEEIAWLPNHKFRKTAATMLDEAGLTARQIADVLGHSQISILKIAICPERPSTRKQPEHRSGACPGSSALQRHTRRAAHPLLIRLFLGVGSIVRRSGTGGDRGPSGSTQHQAASTLAAARSATRGRGNHARKLTGAVGELLARSTPPRPHPHLRRASVAIRWGRYPGMAIPG